MKLSRHPSAGQRQAGILLTECLVYIAVLMVLTGVAMGAFYFCWDHTRAVIYATDQVESALHAGERWRADIRAATGTITVEATPVGQIVWIPQAQKKVIYFFAEGEMRRQLGDSSHFEVLLPRVMDSSMKADIRGPVSAWRWEIKMSSQRKEMHMPLLFTFEAVQPKS